MDLTTERIAEVALVQRLPRHCDGFSYGVPSGMDVRRGTAVRVPFRFASSVPGFVRSVRPGDPHRRGFKWINEIVPDNALSEEEMDRIEETAFETVQSVSAVLYAAFPFFEKNQKGKSSKKEPDAPLEHLPLKIRSSEAAIISSLVTKINRLPCGFFQGRDFSQSAAAVAGYLYAHPDERVVVLVPTVRDVRLLFPRLGASRIVSLTGEESASRRLDAWHAIQKGAARVLVGTRAASLLLPTETDMVFLLNSSDRNHRQETRNPRYDARENAWKLHEHTGCRLAFFDVVPRVEEIVRFGKDRLIFQLIFPPPIRWADLHQEGAASPHPLVSSTAAEAIQNALTEGRRTVFLYDRKGTGRALRCADCRRGFPCPSCGCPFASDEATVVCRHCGRVEPAPTSCPDCGGMRLQEMGYGTRSLQNVFRRLFPNASVSLVQQGRVEDLSADILVTTSFFFESILDPFRREPPIGLFILGDADLPLTRPNYRSLEEAVRDVATLSGMAASFRVPCVIQSRAPKLFQNALERLSEFFSSELALRKQYGLPPSVRRLCVTSRADDPRRARFELDQLAEALTTLEGVRLLPNPPDRHQKLSLGISADLTAVSAVLTRLKQLPDHLVIDANTDL